MTTAPKRRPARKSAPKTLPKAPVTRRKAATKAASRLPAPVEPVREAADGSPSHVLKFAGVFAPFGPMPDAPDLLGAAERLAEFNRRNVRALMESGDILARGCTELGKAWVEFGQQSLSDSAALARSMAGAHLPQDLAALQSDLGRDGLERLQQDAARLSELAVRIAAESLAPLQARLGSVFDLTVKRAA